MLHQLICPYEQRRAQSSAQSTHKVTWINIRRPQNIFHWSHLQLDCVTVQEDFCSLIMWGFLDFCRKFQTKSLTQRWIQREARTRSSLSHCTSFRASILVWEMQCPIQQPNPQVWKDLGYCRKIGTSTPLSSDSWWCMDLFWAASFWVAKSKMIVFYLKRILEYLYWRNRGREGEREESFLSAKGPLCNHEAQTESLCCCVMDWKEKKAEPMILQKQ